MVKFNEFYLSVGINLMKKLSSLIVLILILVCFSLFNLSCDDDNECGDSFCIGIVLPETGSSASGFPTMKAAIDLAVSDITAAGKNINVLFRDSKGNPSEADKVAEELLGIGVHGIVGAWSSAVSLGMIDRVTGNEVVMISPSNTSPSLTEYNEGFLTRRDVQYPYYYRTTPSDVFQGPLMVSTIAGDIATDPVDIVLVYRDDNWGVRLSAEIEKSIESANLAFSPRTVNLSKVSYDHTDPDTATIIPAIQTEVSANTDVIILLVFDEGSEILREMIKSSAIPDPDTVKYYLGDGYTHTDIDDRVSDGDANLIGKTSGIKSIRATADQCRFPEFQTALQRLNPGLIDFAFTSEVYDAIVLLALASLSAGSNEPTEYVSEMIKVSKDGMSCTTYRECTELLTDGDNTNDDIDYNGISGMIGFDENGDISSAFYVISEYDGNGIGSSNVVNRDGTPVGPCP